MTFKSYKQVEAFQLRLLGVYPVYKSHNGSHYFFTSRSGVKFPLDVDTFNIFSDNQSLVCNMLEITIVKGKWVGIKP